MSRGIGRVASDVVGVLLFVPLALVLAAVPWLVDRLVRHDPLVIGKATWSEADRGRRDPLDPWASDRAPRRPRGLLGWWVAARRTVGAVFLAGSVFGIASAVLARLPSLPPIPAAYAGADWYPGYREDIFWVESQAVAFDPLAPVRIRDVATRTVNVRDGIRRSWRPPNCDCRRVRVWIYGGSTTFGAGQRDLHTIASELARVAWEDGIALDIDNRGVVGDTHWEEAQRFAWDLATSPRPDLVVFYDGVNEVEAARQLTTKTRQPISFVTRKFWQEYLAITEPGSAPPPPGGRVLRDPPLPSMDAEEAGAFAVERYLIAKRISGDLARVHQLTVRYFWQPSVADRERAFREYDDGALDWSARRSDGAVAALPPDVADLTDVFDGVRAPLFYDNVHTNEQGARIVAEAMYQRLRPDLAELGS